MNNDYVWLKVWLSCAGQCLFLKMPRADAVRQVGDFVSGEFEGGIHSGKPSKDDGWHYAFLGDRVIALQVVEIDQTNVQAEQMKLIRKCIKQLDEGNDWKGDTE